MNDLDCKKTLAFAKKLSIEAGNLILNKRNKYEISVHKKDFLDVATNVDLAAEKLIISKLKKYYPKFNILSEEKGFINNNSPYTWIIDPLDGTKEFMRNIPTYSVNITLEKNFEIILGVVYYPNYKQMFSALKNNGSYINNHKTAISKKLLLKESFIYTHLPDKRMEKLGFFSSWNFLGKIAYNSYRLRGIGDDMLSLAYVAGGHIEGYVLLKYHDDWGPKWWDLANGILMVEEAGGIVTDFNGNKIKNRDISHGIIATNGKIHQELLSLVNK